MSDDVPALHHPGLVAAVEAALEGPKSSWLRIVEGSDHRWKVHPADFSSRGESWEKVLGGEGSHIAHKRWSLVKDDEVYYNFTLERRGSKAKITQRQIRFKKGGLGKSLWMFLRFVVTHLPKIGDVVKASREAPDVSGILKATRTLEESNGHELSGLSEETRSDLPDLAGELKNLTSVQLKGEGWQGEAKLLVDVIAGVYLAKAQLTWEE